jgi:hypothetical protein
MVLRKYGSRTRRITGYTRDHAQALRCGHDYVPHVFGGDDDSKEGRAKTEELMRAAWPMLKEAAFYLAEEWDSGALPAGYFLYDDSCPEEYQRRGEKRFYTTSGRAGAAMEKKQAIYLRSLGLVPTREEINSAEFYERNYQYLRKVSRRRKTRMNLPDVQDVLPEPKDETKTET